MKMTNAVGRFDSATLGGALVRPPGQAHEGEPRHTESLALAGDEQSSSNPTSSPLRLERGLECRLSTIACLCCSLEHCSVLRRAGEAPRFLAEHRNFLRPASIPSLRSTPLQF